jgi:hypothetical protein
MLLVVEKDLQLLFSLKGGPVVAAPRLESARRSPGDLLHGVGGVCQLSGPNDGEHRVG